MARSTASSYSTLLRFVTTSMSSPCLATIGVLIRSHEVSVHMRAKNSNETTMGKFSILNLLEVYAS